MKEQILISYEWAIAIYRGKTPSKLEPWIEAPETVLTFEDVTDVKADFVADPFMILINDLWYMYFEVLNNTSGLGEIGYAISSDCIQWTYRKIILREKFHLSYPMVFENNQELYMIPETRQAGEIRLYKADAFPEKWRQEKVLVKGNYADATIFNNEDQWWMFALKGTKDLHLFYSDSLLGDWISHPANPIIENNMKTSRPAGRIIKENGSVYRLAQDGVPLYGNKVRMFKIINLNRTSYEERELDESPILKGSRKGWNSIGMHHVDAHQLENKSWIACVDGANPKFKQLKNLKTEIK
ncbi:MAG: hypothetical protein P8J69_04060 [Flavobacteriaceae bacterium]|nr:hypothetical protein [Flavobacteriaceae bacterium]